MKWQEWTPTKHLVLCEKHFKEEDYVCTKQHQTKKYLKKDAIPSIFEFPPHLVKKHRKRRAPPPPKKASPAKKKKKNPVKSDHATYIKSPTTFINKLKKTLKKKE